MTLVVAWLVGLAGFVHAGTIGANFGTGSVQTVHGQGSITTAYGLDAGLIGNTTTLDSNARAAHTFVYSSFTTTTPGRISFCHAKVSNISTGSITIGVYNLDGTILAYYNGTAGTSTAWYGGALNTSIQVASGTSYIIGLVTNDASWSMFKDGSEAGHYRRRKLMTYATTLSNFDFSGSTSDSESNALNIQCDDTAATP